MGFSFIRSSRELIANNIPFVKYGGFKFLESLHIKDVLAHLKVLNNPKDRLSWMRILRLLPGVGIKTALKLAGRIADDGIPPRPADLLTGDPKYRSAFEALLSLIVDLMNHKGAISEKVERINVYYFPFEGEVRQLPKKNARLGTLGRSDRPL